MNLQTECCFARPAFILCRPRAAFSEIAPLATAIPRSRGDERVYPDSHMSRVLRWRWILVWLLVIASASSAHTQPRSSKKRPLQYFFVLLKRPTSSPSMSKEAGDKVEQEHMANIRKLAAGHRIRSVHFARMALLYMSVETVTTGRLRVLECSMYTISCGLCSHHCLWLSSSATESCGK